MMTAAASNAIEVHHYHHFPDGGADGEQLNRGHNAQLAFIRDTIMAVSDEVQAILDLAKQNATLTGSVDQAMKALTVQVVDLQNQINALPTAPASLSADDKAALLSATSDLQGSITTLQGDIPTNVVAVQPAPAAAVQTGLTPAQTQVAVDQHQADSTAASQAKPLAGTGIVVPVISSMVPTSGPDGISVSLLGSGFTEAAVTIGGIAAGALNIISDTSLVFVIPDVGGPVVVTSKSGGVNVSPPVFTLTAPVPAPAGAKVLAPAA